MRTLLGLLKRQRMEQAIGYPRYLIGATGHGASSLRRKPMEPLPLSDLIFLYDDFDIRAWLLANPGKDPLDLLVLEARQDQGQNRDETPAPGSGRYPFFDHRVWNRWGHKNDTTEEENDNHDESHEDGNSDDDEEETLQDTTTPIRRSVMTIEDVSFRDRSAFHSNSIANQSSRTTIVTAVSRSAGLTPGANIPIMSKAVDVPRIHSVKCQTPDPLESRNQTGSDP
jgi:hypothetical protein